MSSTSAAVRVPRISNRIGRRRPTSIATTLAGCACCGVRALDAVGGLRPVFGSATWYEALLRVSETTDRIGHVAQVLYHRRPDARTRECDVALALEVALQRREEAGTIVAAESGLRVRYAASRSTASRS